MSAHTMRLLVKLSKEKQRKKDQQALSPNGNKKNIRRGKTLTNVDATPEEIVARRISHIAQDKSPPPTSVTSTKQVRPTHIRSYSEPKDTIEDVTNVALDGGSASTLTVNSTGHDEKTENRHNQTDSLSRHSDNSAVPSEDDSAASDVKPAAHQALPSVGSQSVSSTHQDSFASRTQSHTQTYSQTVSHSSFAPSIRDKFHGKGGRAELSVASMSTTGTFSNVQSVQSVSTTLTISQSQASNASGVGHPTGTAPPALDTASDNNSSLRYDSLGDILSKNHSARHAKDKDETGPKTTGTDIAGAAGAAGTAGAADVPNGAPSVFVQSDSEDGGNAPKSSTRGHQSRPSLEKVEEHEQLNTNTANTDDEIDRVNTNASDMTNIPDDISPDVHNDTNSNMNNNTSIWSSLCCCCGSSASNNHVTSNTDSSTQTNLSQKQTRLPSASAYGQMNKSRSEDFKDENASHKQVALTSRSIELGQNSYAASKNTPSEHDSLRLDALTATTTTQLRRPTQFSTQTKNEDQTIEPGDVRLWDEPFGKGASGRVFKAVYLPLCQVLAVKVVNRLDNENVKQVLGEFRDQQELLPDCDRLMRIFGWYRDLERNTVVIALEYMDMGSIYDSCFPKDRANSGDNLLNNTAEEQDKSGHKQVTVDKLTHDQLRFIARESLVGLNALHLCDPPLVHRDVKPQNILCSSFGEVKIADFGLLKRVSRQTHRLYDSKGTEKYFSPERINKDYGTKCDIWALGITMIEIYNQELIPVDQLDWFKLVDDGIDINDFIPATAPTEFVDFLKKCLMSDESHRPTATQLLAHKFVSRGWGNALEARPNLSRKKLVTFADIKPDQKTLDKLLSWLEVWILADESQNAKVFSEGDPEYLKTCVHNLARFTGNSPEYIDRYIAEVYREHVSSRK